MPKLTKTHWSYCSPTVTYVTYLKWKSCIFKPIKWKLMPNFLPCATFPWSLFCDCNKSNASTETHRSFGKRRAPPVSSQKPFNVVKNWDKTRWYHKKPNGQIRFLLALFKLTSSGGAWSLNDLHAGGGGAVRPKGLPFADFRYQWKGRDLLVKVMKGWGNLSFLSVKGLKREDKGRAQNNGQST